MTLGAGAHAAATSADRVADARRPSADQAPPARPSSSRLPRFRAQPAAVVSRALGPRHEFMPNEPPRRASLCRSRPDYIEMAVHCRAALSRPASREGLKRPATDGTLLTPSVPSSKHECAWPRPPQVTWRATDDRRLLVASLKSGSNRCPTRATAAAQVSCRLACVGARRECPSRGASRDQPPAKVDGCHAAHLGSRC